jgi:hypothetical protein
MALVLDPKRYLCRHLVSDEAVSCLGVVYFMLTIDDMYKAFQLSG